MLLNKQSLNTVVLYLSLALIGCGTEKHLEPTRAPVQDPAALEPVPVIESPCEAINATTDKCIFYGHIMWIYHSTDNVVCTCFEGHCRKCEVRCAHH